MHRQDRRMIDMSSIAGVIGLTLDILVAPTQLLYLLKTRQVSGIFIGTYIFLVGAMLFYLLHAVLIHDLIFTIAMSVSLVTDLIILVLLLKWRKRSGKEKNR